MEVKKDIAIFKERLFHFYKNGQGFEHFVVSNAALKANRCGIG